MGWDLQDGRQQHRAQCSEGQWDGGQWDGGCRYSRLGAVPAAVLCSCEAAVCRGGSKELLNEQTFNNSWSLNCNRNNDK